MEPRPAGTRPLSAQHDKAEKSRLGAFASAGTSRSRIDAARQAIAELGTATGTDAASFAERYGNASYGGRSVAQIRQQARFDFVQSALARSPDQADALIAVRLRGVDGDSRAIARAAVEQSGAKGAARYAVCEKALATISRLNADERGDVAGMIRSGERFDRAIDTENKELARVRAEQARPATRGSTSALREQAVRNAHARAAGARRLAVEVRRTVHGIGKLSRGAELLAGAGAATSTVGAVIVGGLESAATRSTKPLARAADEAGHAGAFMAGELTDKIRKADETAVKFLKVADRFESTFNRHVAAIRDGDHQEVAATEKQLQALAEGMKQHAESLAIQAKSIGKLSSAFDGAARHAALAVLVAGAAYAVGTVGGAQHAAHGAAHWAGHGVKHAAVEGVVGRIYGAATHGDPHE